MPAARFAVTVSLSLMLSTTVGAETFRFQGRVDVVPAGAAQTRSSPLTADGCTGTVGPELQAAPARDDSGNAQIARISDASGATSERGAVQLPSCVISVVYE